MALRALRPTGNRILAPDGSPPALFFATHYHTYWLNSGTAALALAIIAARSTSSSKYPEVVLPAYGCPDLVAAACYAGVRAVLIDIQANSPHFDYTQLSAAISNDTIAIVAPALLGIRPIEQPLRDIISSRGIALIEDSAQWFPRNSSQTFFGDYVVLSFGRGKPVNILGGGALLARKSLDRAVTKQIATIRPPSAIKQRLRINAYNALIQPTAYGIAEKMPFLHIGETAYHELIQIAEMSAPQQKLLSANLNAFQQGELSVQTHWREALANLNGDRAIDLSAQHNVPRDYALLRYPMLIKSKSLRDTVYTALRQRGLGASIMYARPLAAIPGVIEHATASPSQANAIQFSNELLTLPTHDAVTPKTISETMSIIKRHNLY